jgi:uncharacterized protein YndB with AHSA1/START domain
MNSPTPVKTTHADTLIITREFNHSPETLFKAWTDRDALSQWMGPPSKTCPNTEIDPRLNGNYAFPMVSEGGDGGLDTVVGTFIQFEPHSALAFTWRWLQEDGSKGQEMEVYLTFESQENGTTKMTLTQINFLDNHIKDMHQQGWEGSFSCLSRYLTP